VNVDFDGQANDDPAPATCSGVANFTESGAYWNGIHGLGNASSIAASGLRTADGNVSPVNLSIETRSGNANINFDHYAEDPSPNLYPALVKDYFYLFNKDTIDIEISGLRPGKTYGLSVYGRVAFGWQLGFNGLSLACSSDGDRYFFKEPNDAQGNNDGRAVTYAHLKADEHGKIAGSMYTDNGEPMVIYGLQLWGSICQNGLVVLIK